MFCDLYGSDPKKLGYNRIEDLDNYMSSKALVDLLIEKVATGGNLLLDIGPTADGRIPVIMQQRLIDIGDWLKVNGEAIYGTQVWAKKPAQPVPGIFYTVKGKDLYVICTTWPQKAITIPGVLSAGRVILLGSDAKVTARASGNAACLPGLGFAMAGRSCRLAVF